MILLSIATSGDPCSVAVCDEKGVLSERTFRHRMHLSERLVGDVDEILRDAGVSLDVIDAFAVDIGPGSFTGVRVGVTTVKTWTDLLCKPVIGVSALEVAAYTHFAQHADIVVPMIRARPGSVYASFYEGENGEELRSPALLTAAEAVDLVLSWRGKQVTICGDGWTAHRELIQLSTKGRRLSVAFAPARALQASLLDEIARMRIQLGRIDQPIDLVPLYIAPPPIGPAARASGNSG